MLRGAHAGMAMVDDVADAVNDQTVVGVAFGFGGGGDISALTAILAGAEGVADIAHKALQAAVEERTAIVQDRTFACMQKTIEELQVVNGKLDTATTELYNKLDRNYRETQDLRQAMDAQLAVLEVLLNTPLGQRPEFSGQQN